MAAVLVPVSASDHLHDELDEGHNDPGDGAEDGPDEADDQPTVHLVVAHYLHKIM